MRVEQQLKARCAHTVRKQQLFRSPLSLTQHQRKRRRPRVRDAMQFVQAGDRRLQLRVAVEELHKINDDIGSLVDEDGFQPLQALFDIVDARIKTFTRQLKKYQKS